MTADPEQENSTNIKGYPAERWGRIEISSLKSPAHIMPLLKFITCMRLCQQSRIYSYECRCWDI